VSEALLQAYIPSVATLILVGVGILFNNSRIADLNMNLNKRIDDVNNRIDDLRTDMREQYSRLETLVVGKLGEVESA
jgi:chaperonin cofactor prefoldin